VHMMTRSRENAEAAMERLKAFYQSASSRNSEGTRCSVRSFKVIEMDLVAFDSVKRAA
jgi:hypothetical protein